jgi:signal transduction histidine kinase
MEIPRHGSDSSLYLFLKLFLTVAIRTRLFLIFFVFGIIPMVTLCAVNYLSGSRAVEQELRRGLGHDARVFAVEVGNRVRNREASLKRLVDSKPISDFIDLKAKVSPQGAGQTNSNREVSAVIAQSTTAGSSNAANVSEELRNVLLGFYLRNSRHFSDITIFDEGHSPVLRAEPAKTGNGIQSKELTFETKDFAPSSRNLDENVWTTSETQIARPALLPGTTGAILRYTIPIFMGTPSAQCPRGAFVFEAAADSMLMDAVQVQEDSAPVSSGDGPNSTRKRIVVVLAKDGKILFHSNEGLRAQPAALALPESLRVVIDEMTRGKAGWAYNKGPDGADWLTAFEPIPSLNFSVSVAENVDGAFLGPRRAAWLSLAIAGLVGLITATLLSLSMQKMTRSIERVTAGAVAIAAGDLNQRIEVTSSDETKLLAESFNQMTDRLKEQMVREAESRQFESFTRLSAMLTHDLKNAIAGLSLLVGNMEKQFHREEFRRDAMQSLLQSTEKLSALVAKLTGPVQSLSGEHERPRPTDLVPLLRSAVSSLTTHGTDSRHVIMNLPEQLIAIVEPDRIEKVIENLIINALDAMEFGGGTLKVEAGKEDEVNVFFSISDTGVGISDEFQRLHLFHAFATTKQDGVGLGLYTCSEVVKAHGGHIQVHSIKGSGTTFRVVLPSSQVSFTRHYGQGTVIPPVKF